MEEGMFGEGYLGLWYFVLMTRTYPYLIGPRNSWLSGGLRCHPEDSVWVKRKQTTGRPCGRNISLRETPSPLQGYTER
jgi:hypothetical protein